MLGDAHLQHSPPTKGYNSDEEYVPVGMRRSVSSSTPPPYMVTTGSRSNINKQLFQSEVDIVKGHGVRMESQRAISKSQSPVVSTPDLPVRSLRSGSRASSDIPESTPTLPTQPVKDSVSASPNRMLGYSNITYSNSDAFLSTRVLPTRATTTSPPSVSKKNNHNLRPPEQIWRSPGELRGDCTVETSRTELQKNSTTECMIKYNQTFDSPLEGNSYQLQHQVESNKHKEHVNTTELVTQLKSKLSKQHILILEKDSKINSLEKTLKTTRKEALEYKNTATDAENDLLKLDKLIDSKGMFWKQHKDSLEQKITAAEKVKNDVEEQLLILTTKCQLDRADHNHAIEEYEHRVQQSRDVIQKISIQKKTLERKILDKSEANKALIETLNNTGLRQQTAISDVKTTHMTERQTDMRTICEQQLVIDQLSNSSENSLSTIADLKQKLNTITEKHDSIIDELKADHVTETESYKNEISELEKSHQTNEHNLNEMKNQVAMLQRQHHSQQASITTLKLSNSTTKTDSDQLQQLVIALKKDLMNRDSTLSVQSEKYQLTLNGLRDQNEVLRKELNEKTEIITNQHEHVKEVLSRKEDELRQLEDRCIGMKQLNPSQLLDSDLDNLLSKEAFIRSVLAQSLCDIIWLHSAVSDRKKASLESFSDSSQRVAGLSTETVAKKLQEGIHKLISTVQPLLMSDRYISTTDQTEGDCIIM